MSAAAFMALAVMAATAFVIVIMAATAFVIVIMAATAFVIVVMAAATFVPFFFSMTAAFMAFLFTAAALTFVGGAVCNLFVLAHRQLLFFVSACKSRAKNTGSFE